MKILFLGESWQGSCARSLKEALERQSGITLIEISEDALFPKVKGLFLRGVNRFLAPAYRRELYAEIRRQVDRFRPSVLIVYKGHSLSADFLKEIRARGIAIVNIYPDYSPHAYGARHRRAIAEYDLVISTKPFHPQLWKTLYGYDNPCVFVPHGYNPHVHLDASEPVKYGYDIGMIATWRPEYGEWMTKLAASLGDSEITVGVGGSGWQECRTLYPKAWSFVGPISGRSYIEWLRGARICLAPVNRHVVINGQRQPGDEDTSRTYELAAGKCFFLHRRTDYLQTIYDEKTEVPMYDSPEELADLIVRFLPIEQERRRFADAAHRRAVPAYSLDARAAEVVRLIGEQIGARP
ncbi:MAG TPA: glycosyltransferase [Bacteriovoracaceae bacterium]|nr:glycosyltransferase [Bacteriovoracaceae bacterium]